MGLFNTKPADVPQMPENPIVCPFCGNRSTSEKFCSSCGAKFTREVLQVASREKDDTRDDRIGPFSTKTAKRLLWVLIIVLVALFIFFTERLRDNPMFN